MSNNYRDIQALHRVITLLERANSQSERIIEELPGLYLVINDQFNILRGNLVASKTLNIDYEDLLRTDFSTLFKTETWLIFRHYFEQIEKADFPSSVRFELSIYDHSHHLMERPFYWHLSKMQDVNNAEGVIYSLMGEDISELREAENKLSGVFANIPLGILTIDEHGNIEETYSSFLSCLLGDNNISGRSFRSVVFAPIEQDLTSTQKIGIDNIFACLNSEEKNFVVLEESFPKHIFFYAESHKTEGKYLQISYQAVVSEGIVKRLLIILEDRTATVKAEKDQKRAKFVEQESQAIYERAIRDPLTGLYTRLYMTDHAEVMLNNHNRHNVAAVSLVLFDIDHFKTVNDIYGHDIGDKVLKEVASIIIQQARDTDLPIRFGGEEFMVFMSATVQSGYLLAERIRKKVSTLVLNAEGKAFSVTISGGIASHSEGQTIAQLIKRADQLLYKAKNLGRNRNIKDDI